MVIAAPVLFLSSLPAVLVGAHSHNDYNQKRPLLDALQRGYASIEVDVCLINGELLVAHEPKSAKPERTLRNLYLEPLRHWIRDNGGRAIRSDEPLQLLVDFKSPPAETYEMLKVELAEYADLLVEREVGLPPVQIVISGNRPMDQVKSERDALVKLDGRPEDLLGTTDRRIMPMISADWFTTIGWLGVGSLSRDQVRRLEDLVKRTHLSGRKLRFWGVPSGERAWKLLQNYHVDYLGTDDLDRLREFVLRNPRKKQPDSKGGNG